VRRGLSKGRGYRSVNGSVEIEKCTQRAFDVRDLAQRERRRDDAIGPNEQDTIGCRADATREGTLGV
jgi:hypothetical protein